MSLVIGDMEPPASAMHGVVRHAECAIRHTYDVCRLPSVLGVDLIQASRHSAHLLSMDPYVNCLSLHVHLEHHMPHSLQHWNCTALTGCIASDSAWPTQVRAHERMSHAHCSMQRWLKGSADI